MPTPSHSALHPAAQPIVLPESNTCQFSICTLVTRAEEYREMVDSFLQAGFTTADCEYLFIDNTAGNQAEAFAGCNIFLQSARGRYIILAHQDILLRFHHRADLESRLMELDRVDPHWALAGNAGGIAPEVSAVRITHTVGEQNTGDFPALVRSLDENFIVVKKKANLSLSRDLQGFHFYGTDLCEIARVLGWSAWVIDFNLYHKSEGNFDESYFAMSRTLAKKYQRALRGGPIQTMGMRVYFSSSALANLLWTHSRRRMIYELKYSAEKNRRKGAPVSSAPVFLNHPLGMGWCAFYWVAHKIRIPFENLFHSLAKRRRKKARHAAS